MFEFDFCVHHRSLKSNQSPWIRIKTTGLFSFFYIILFILWFFNLHFFSILDIKSFASKSYRHRLSTPVSPIRLFSYDNLSHDNLSHDLSHDNLSHDNLPRSFACWFLKSSYTFFVYKLCFYFIWVFIHKSYFVDFDFRLPFSAVSPHLTEYPLPDLPSRCDIAVC